MADTNGLRKFAKERSAATGNGGGRRKRRFFSRWEKIIKRIV